MRIPRLIGRLLASASASSYLKTLPAEFNETVATWAWLSNDHTSLAVLPGHFNRTVFQAPVAATVSDPDVAALNQQLNKTDFVAYDEKFFEVIGPNATIDHVQHLAYQIHEASCYMPDHDKLFFVEWGPQGGNDGYGVSQPYQYLLDIKTNNLSKITTDPPIWNVHGCVYYNGSLHVVTDGSQNETGILARIDPVTLQRTTLLNNYYEEPFDGFNDLEIDPDGNFWLTDSLAGWGRDLNPFALTSQASVYFVNGKTMRPKVVYLTTGNTNGIASSPDGSTIYLQDTGASQFKPAIWNPEGQRELWAFDVKDTVLTNQRLLNNPIAYIYDGVRVSRNGWIFVGAGDGVEILDPKTGFSLGSIRLGGGSNVAVNIAFGKHDLFIVGKGGVWHVKNIAERLDRDW